MGENIPIDKKNEWREYTYGLIRHHNLKDIEEWNDGLDEAAMWYQEAANKNYVPAQYRLGQLYDRLSYTVYGDEREDYIRQSREWYHKAAEKGYAKAQYGLGHSYERSEMTYRAIEWYRKAAEQGDDGAQLRLGELTHSAYWVRKAAEQGFLSDAAYLIGVMYHFGEGGVSRNVQESLFWLKMAASQGNIRADEFLKTYYPSPKKNKEEWLFIIGIFIFIVFLLYIS